jgi:hypothetical protein
VIACTDRYGNLDAPVNSTKPRIYAHALFFCHDLPICSGTNGISPIGSGYIMDASTQTARQDAGMADAYARALSHSARVRRLKILLPVLALAISLAFIAVSWVRSMIPDGLSISGAKIENGYVVIERPALSGRNDNGIAYYVNARRALQGIANPNDIIDRKSVV